MENTQQEEAAGVPLNEPSANEELNCKFCDKVFNSVISYIDHIRCRDHFKMIRIAEIKSKSELLEKFREVEDSNVDRTFVSDQFVCPECGKPFSSWKSADDHFRSAQHIRKISDNEMELVLFNMKPKILCSTNDIINRRLPNTSLKNGAGQRTKQPNISNQTVQEPVKHCKGKVLVKDVKDQVLQDKTRNSVLNKAKLQTGKMASTDLIPHSSSKEMSKVNTVDAAIKEHISKLQRDKMSSKKVNSRNQKRQEEAPNASSNHEDIEPNQIVRSTKGIAYFLPSESLDCIKTGPENVPSLNKNVKHCKGRMVTKNGLKDRRVQEGVSPSSNIRGQVPEILVPANGAGSFKLTRKTVSGYADSRPGKSNFDNVTEVPKRMGRYLTLKDNRKQKDHYDLGTENLSVRNDDEALSPNSGLRKRYYQNNKLSTIEGNVKKCSQNRMPNQSSNSRENFDDAEIFIPILSSNKGHKSPSNSTIMDQIERKARGFQINQHNGNNQNQHIPIINKTRKLATNQSSINKRTIGYCQNCGHPYINEN